MAKKQIAFVTNGQQIGSRKVKPIKRWQLVDFPGPGGQESSGIVDLLALRKDHKHARHPLKKGDLLEIIIIQIKGTGGKHPKKPTKKENLRLDGVRKYYNARSVVLVEWVKGRRCEFYWLTNPYREPKKAWGSVDPGVAFS